MSTLEEVANAVHSFYLALGVQPETAVFEFHWYPDSDDDETYLVVSEAHTVRMHG